MHVHVRIYVRSLCKTLCIANNDMAISTEVKKKYYHATTESSSGDLLFIRVMYTPNEDLQSCRRY